MYQRQVLAIERSPQALNVARENVVTLNCSNVDLLCGCWLNAIADDSVAMVRKNGAALLLEHGCEQGAAVRQLLTHHGYHGIATFTDLAGLERVSLGYVVKKTGKF